MHAISPRTEILSLLQIIVPLLLVVKVRLSLIVTAQQHAEWRKHAIADTTMAWLLAVGQQHAHALHPRSELQLLAHVGVHDVPFAAPGSAAKGGLLSTVCTPLQDPACG